MTRQFAFIHLHYHHDCFDCVFELYTYQLPVNQQQCRKEPKATITNMRTDYQTSDMIQLTQDFSSPSQMTRHPLASYQFEPGVDVETAAKFPLEKHNQ